MLITMNNGEKHTVKIASFALGYCYADSLKLSVKDIMAIQPIK